MQTDIDVQQQMDAAVHIAESGDIRGALAALDIVRDQGVASHHTVILAKARACERAGYLNKALQYTNSAAKVLHNGESDNYKPGHTYFSMFPLYAEILYRLGEMQELNYLCRRWGITSYERKYYYLNRARLIHARKKASEAEKHIDAILEFETRFAQAHTLKGDLMADAEDYIGAIQQYDTALEIDPVLMHVYAKKAKIYQRTKKPNEAIQTCEQGLNIQANNRMLQKLRNNIQA